MSDLREECGVFGVYSAEKSDVASTSYYGLFALQHRVRNRAELWLMMTAFLTVLKTRVL